MKINIPHSEMQGKLRGDIWNHVIIEDQIENHRRKKEIYDGKYCSTAIGESLDPFPLPRLHQTLTHTLKGKTKRNTQRNTSRGNEDNIK
jgi:hypothetical protein